MHNTSEIAVTQSPSNTFGFIACPLFPIKSSSGFLKTSAAYALPKHTLAIETSCIAVKKRSCFALNPDKSAAFASSLFAISSN